MNLYRVQQDHPAVASITGRVIRIDLFNDSTQVIFQLADGGEFGVTLTDKLIVNDETNVFNFGPSSFSLKMMPNRSVLQNIDATSLDTINITLRGMAQHYDRELHESSRTYLGGYLGYLSALDFAEETAKVYRRGTPYQGDTYEVGQLSSRPWHDQDDNKARFTRRTPKQVNAPRTADKFPTHENPFDEPAYPPGGIRLQERVIRKTGSPVADYDADRVRRGFTENDPTLPWNDYFIPKPKQGDGVVNLSYVAVRTSAQALELARITPGALLYMGDRWEPPTGDRKMGLPEEILRPAYKPQLALLAPPDYKQNYAAAKTGATFWIQHDEGDGAVWDDGVITFPAGVVEVYRQYDEAEPDYTALRTVQGGRVYAVSWNRSFSRRYCKTLARAFLNDVIEGEI